MAVTMLEREMYTEAEAARLLGLPQRTLNYWLEGGVRRGKTYQPVIRIEPKRTNRVTWAEFIEAGLLSQYRRLQVPMPELRAFVGRLRDSFEVAYPLAHRRPWVSGKELVIEAQDDVGLSPEFALVAAVSGHPLLLPAAEAFVTRVTWRDDWADGWRPDARPASPVTIDPGIRFGSPSIGGISTAILYEQSEAGEDERDLADTFGLDVSQVRWAISYELGDRAA